MQDETDEIHGVPKFHGRVPFPEGWLRSYLPVRDRRLGSLLVMKSIRVCLYPLWRGALKGQRPRIPASPSEGVLCMLTFRIKPFLLLSSTTHRHDPHHRARRAVYSTPIQKDGRTFNSTSETPYASRRIIINHRHRPQL